MLLDSDIYQNHIDRFALHIQSNEITLLGQDLVNRGYLQYG